MQLISHQCFLYINQIIVNRTTLSPVLLLSWKFTVISQQPILFASMILLVVNLPSAHPILPYSILSSGNSQYFLLLWSYYCSCKSDQCPPYPVLSSAHPIQYFHQPTANTYCLNVLICCKSAHPIPMYCHLPATNCSGLYDLICCKSAHPIPCYCHRPTLSPVISHAAMPELTDLVGLIVNQVLHGAHRVILLVPKRT